MFFNSSMKIKYPSLSFILESLFISLCISCSLNMFSLHIWETIKTTSCHRLVLRRSESVVHEWTSETSDHWLIHWQQQELSSNTWHDAANRCYYNGPPLDGTNRPEISQHVSGPFKGQVDDMWEINDSSWVSTMLTFEVRNLIFAGMNTNVPQN